MAPLDKSAGGCAAKGAGRLWAVAAVAALALYVATLTPGLAWQDSGDYQYEAARLQLSRPGDAVRVHPWFLVVAWSLGHVGLWDYAYAANLASAVGTALAVGNVGALGWLLTKRRWPAVLAAVTFAVGHAVWWHATMAETYGWEAAFLSAECLCAWAWLAGGRARWLLLLFFINGVAISNHLMASLSLTVFGVWLLAACLRARARWWVLPAAGGCWLLGGTLYWIVVGMEYERSGSVLATLHSATVGAWGGQVFNLSDLPALFGKSVLYVGLTYPTPVALAILVGIVALWRRGRTFGRLIVILAALYFFWAARYKVVDQYAFFVPFYALGSVLIGAGVWRLWPELRGGRAWLLLCLVLLPVGVYAVLPCAAQKAGLTFFFRRELPYRNPYTYFLRPWRTGDSSARRFAEDTLDALPPRAVLFCDSTPAAPLVCIQKLEGRRPDVLIAASSGLPADLLKRYWGSEHDLMPEFGAEGRRVFVVTDQAAYMPSWMVDYTRRVPFDHIFEAKALGP